MVEEFLNHKFPVNQAINEFGSTLLMHAIVTGHCAVTKFLLERGADISIEDNANNSALSLASAKAL